MLTRCHNCNAYIETLLGADPPGEHEDAAGTADDPRAPGDWDNVCDVCNYRDGVGGGVLDADDVAWGAHGNA